MKLLAPDKILVENKCQGYKGEYKISWQKSALANYYRVYFNYVPYGVPTLIADNLTDLTYTFTNFDVIDGTELYFIVASIRDNNGTITEARSRYQRAQNTSEFMSFSQGTWLDNNNMMCNPHTNLYPDASDAERDTSYIGVNPLPLEEFRRYQFNRILRDELWILQDRGEPVYLIKKKRVNYDQPEDDDDRRQGRSNIVQFYSPIIICAAIASPGQTHNVYVSGRGFEKSSRSWTIYTPLLNDEDILIDKENKRWELQNVTHQRSWRGAITWQSFDIKALPITDPVYSHPTIKNVDGTLLYQKNISEWNKEPL